MRCKMFWPVLSAALVIVAAYAPATAVSSPPSSVTGGGWIVLSTGGKGTFGLVGRDASTGHVEYINHDTGLRVRSTSISSFTTGCTSTLSGSGVSNAGPVTFDVTVTDNGEPGSLDTFTIHVAGAVSDDQSGSLQGGNIRVHGGACP